MKLSQPQFCKDLTRNTAFLEGWSWFKFNKLGLPLGTNLKFYTSVAKELKQKVRKFWGLIPAFVEVTGEKLVEGPFCPPILNRVNFTKTLQGHHFVAVGPKNFELLAADISFESGLQNNVLPSLLLFLCACY